MRRKKGTPKKSEKTRHSTPGHLPNAPIIEALVELRVELPPGTGMDQVAEVQTAFRDAYPERVNRLTWTGRLDLGDESAPPSVPERRVDGYFFKSADRTRVVQARLDGFAMHWLKPYATWEDLRAEARARWEDFRRVLNPVAISRIEVRYINRIELPLPIPNMQEWLLTVPEVSPSLHRPLAHFFMQLQIPFPEREAVCLVTETIDRDKPEVAAFILDIDVIRERRFAADTDEAWIGLESLRQIKNEVFFKSITPKTKRLFQ